MPKFAIDVTIRASFALEAANREEAEERAEKMANLYLDGQRTGLRKAALAGLGDKIYEADVEVAEELNGSNGGGKPVEQWTVDECCDWLRDHGETDSAGDPNIPSHDVEDWREAVLLRLAEAANSDD